MLPFKEASIPHPAIDLNIQNQNRNQSNFTILTPLEQEFYYWVNYSRSNPRRFFDSVVTPIANVYPQLRGENYESLLQDVTKTSTLPLLTLNIGLIKMAKEHADDIVSHDAKPSHTSTNGRTFADRFKEYDLRYCGGENLTYGVN